MELNQDFKEFIGLLNKFKVRYLIVGGYAVNLHGYPRYTKDIDIWIERVEENIDLLMKSLNAFGFTFSNLDKADFLRKEVIVQLGYEPYRIDLMVDIDGLVFETCFESRQTVNLAGIPIHFLGIDDLIEAKNRAARPQDLADAHKLSQLRDEKKDT